MAHTSVAFHPFRENFVIGLMVVLIVGGTVGLLFFLAYLKALVWVVGIAFLVVLVGGLWLGGKR